MPRLSVIIRSYNRLANLVELLERVLGQDHDSFEVVIVEQSVERPPEAAARVDELARDPRVRLLRHPPLGGPRARNVGVRAARGDILVLIDDDDLPIGTDWLTRHEANYADPACLGVTGRHLYEGVDDIAGPDHRPYRNMDRAYRSVLSLNALGFQRVFVRTDRRARVQTVHGTNVSLRRTAVERFGLWDECTPIEDEASFNYRMVAGIADNEYLAFDPEAPILRRLDAPGGMAKRGLSAQAYAKKLFTFFHDITGHYFPVRFALLYPAYYVYAAYRVGDWVCSMSRRHDTRARQIAALGGFYVTMPALWLGWLGRRWYRRLRGSDLPQRPRLELAGEA